MNEHLPESQQVLSEEVATELMRSLLHKEGNWVEWGKGCQKLQKSGYSAEIIFEKTGFQKVQQNLIIVASQVYESLVNSDVSETILNYFLGPKSDVLYEFRVLNHKRRAAAAETAYEKNLDNEVAKELAKAIQEFIRFSQLPSGFTDHPGDAIAYQCWKSARQTKNLQTRTRLIAKGLKFAHSPSARTAIEQLLSDLSVTPTRKAPLIPLHRVENDEELSRLVPVAGTWPLTREQINAVQAVNIIEPFGMVEYSGSGAVVPLPGWQIVLKAIDPIAFFCQSGELSDALTNKNETVLVVIDRAAKEWDENGFFLVEQEEHVKVDWFESAPTVEILGQAIVVLRPKRIFDENNLLEPWQMDD
ncbi:MAG: hypothetical protein DCF12_14450 [Snowella sp.]|nr:MAG: hypothetical protein DCF12_14450 [Snowella sp.]